MIICPNCKEEIDDDSRYCDQCGQALLYCSSCGRVGRGRRCTHCGGLMVDIDQLRQQVSQQTSVVKLMEKDYRSISITSISNRAVPEPVSSQSIPVLILNNDSLKIRITGINGAMIGRRQGPYKEMFEKNMYVSGVHAQLIYNQETGWCIIDKHSSNGTQLGQRLLQPDIPMSLKNGDIVTIANVNLQVSISNG